jgi:hypothetical protein
MWDEARVRDNVKKAETEDLLDRATVYRGEMEPAAVAIVEEELRGRGYGAGRVREHAEARAGQGILWEGGGAVRCTYCLRPAVTAGWGWLRMFGVLPVLPRYVFRCAAHRAGQVRSSGTDPRRPG